jgi:L-threonylcarbamoyladenylate synthase
MTASHGKPENVISLNQQKTFGEDVQRCATAVRQGSVILYPTDTIYGLGCDALRQQSVERVYRIKRREETKPMLVLVNSIEMALSLIDNAHSAVSDIMNRCWPGPLTLLCTPRAGKYEWLAVGSGKIGVRFPRHDFCCELIRLSAVPLLSTSANLSGKEYTGDIRQLKDEFVPLVDLVVDAGELPASPPSTVVDVTGEIPEIVREGAFPRSELLKVIGG